jgi:FPC/CPF motif-containing protein YcgG
LSGGFFKIISLFRPGGQNFSKMPWFQINFWQLKICLMILDTKNRGEEMKHPDDVKIF